MFFERINNNEWRFVESLCISNLQNEFDKALEYFEIGKYQLAKRMLHSIIDRCIYHVDAIHHLAVIADIEGKAEKFYLFEKKAVDAAFKCFPDEFQFGKDTIEWGWLENRPFLRAYHGLGLAYFKRKAFQEALYIFTNLLSFNPNDNQGVRCSAVNCYFYLDQPHNVISLCNKYFNDTSCEFIYGKPLALFQLGKIEESQKALEEAIVILPFVAKELLKKSHKTPKSFFEGTFTHGGIDEAYEYWIMSKEFWLNTPGALDFLKRSLLSC